MHMTSARLTAWARALWWLAAPLLVIACAGSALSDQEKLERDGTVGELQEQITIATSGTYQCTASQRDTSTASDVVVQYAEPVAFKASAALLTAGTPLYVRWFGPWDASGGATVNGALNDMVTKDAANSYTGDCNNNSLPNSCGSSAFIEAWASRTLSTVAIHLCAAYFSETQYLNGDQNESQTLTHEKSHLAAPAILDKSDAACGGAVCYGADNALALAASTNYIKARSNAENYGMFVQDVYTTTVVVPAMIPLFL